MRIHSITTPMVLNVTVNCYLVESEGEFVMIDTGAAHKREDVERELGQAGCQPGQLKLILLTHGDFDHCGNAAYFRQKFGVKIGMHCDDLGMVERGNMFWNRKEPNIVIRSLMQLLIRLDQNDRFVPDFLLEDNTQVKEGAFQSKVIPIPGHSKGSVGYLMASGELFCGDLLANRSQPDLWSIIDDMAAALDSVQRLSELDITTVYPGHGNPFLMQEFKESFDKTNRKI